MDSNNILSSCLSQCDVDGIISVFENGLHVNIDYRDVGHGHQTYLMRLCHLDITPTQRLDVLDLMLRAHPDVNLCDSNGRSVLHHACIGQCTEILQTLACCTKCHSSLVDNDGNTPLILAVLSKNLDFLEGFLESFGNKNLKPQHKNSKGYTAYDEAVRKQLHKISDLLETFYNMSSKNNYVVSATKATKQNANNGVSNGKISRRQLRKNQAERLAPVIVSNRTSSMPQRNEQIELRSSSHTEEEYTVRKISNNLCYEEKMRIQSIDEIEQSYFAEFHESPTTSGDEYSDEFSADDEDEGENENQYYEQTIVDINFNAKVHEHQLEKSSSFSLPDLRHSGHGSLVCSSNPSSSASVRSEGAKVKHTQTLRERFGSATKKELSLPQLTEISQDSSSDETSDDSYTEPLTPRSKTKPKESFSLPDIPSHRSNIPKLAMTNLGLTPRNVDIVFATSDSESSAPNTFRGVNGSPRGNLADSLPHISSRSVKVVPGTSRTTAIKAEHEALTPRNVGNNQGHFTHVMKDQPDTWLYNKSQRKAELRLVGTQYNR